MTPAERGAAHRVGKGRRAVGRTRFGAQRFSAISSTLAVVVLMGCGARTVPLTPDEREDGGRDAALSTDAGPRDGGARDGGGLDPDAGPVMRCMADRDCVGLACAGDAPRAGDDLAPMPLACSVLRPGAADGADCDRNEDCARGLCVVAGTCVAPCAEDSDCAPTDRCEPVHVRSGPAALQPLRACVARFDVPEGVVTSEIDLGPVLTGAPMGDVVDLPAVPPSTVVMLTGAGQRTVLESLETRDAAPVLLFDYASLSYEGPPPLNPTYPEGDPIVILLPNGPRGVVSPAGYRARMTATRAGSLRMSTVTTGLSGSLLHLDLYYVGPRGLEPVGDRGPRDVAAAIDAAEEILSRFGVRIGTVRQHEVVGGLRDRYSILETDDESRMPELADLFRLSAGAGRPTVSVFFVRQMDLALGIAGGAPGPQGVHGTAASGVAIAVDLHREPGLPIDLDMGRTLAHELGHYLGLFHTSEADGLILEPLPDTPECDYRHDTDGDGFVLPEECEDAGADNLMFWAASGDALTAQQGDVIRRMPILTNAE